MITLDVKLRGVDRVLATLRRGVDLDAAIGQGLGEWAKDLHDGQLYGMENYAPPPANSSYIRTGRLGANWGLSRPRKTAVSFNNTSSYARYVVGDSQGGRQAAIHAGRWWIARKKILAAVPEAHNHINRAVRRRLLSR